MKIKLDENIPVLLVPELISLGHDVDTVRDEGLLGEADPVFWEAVCREGRFFITQDLDFSDIRKFAPGTHSGLLLVRFDNPSLFDLLHRLRETMTQYDVERWSGCLVTVSEKKVRVFRSPE
ncbi:MAG: DUF5615 family PIN-like protein [Magnetococcales bacterium]|nr:DUF5615 family PIN-like protein [Magnetococcales bacterium]